MLLKTNAANWRECRVLTAARPRPKAVEAPSPNPMGGRAVAIDWMPTFKWQRSAGNGAKHRCPFKTANRELSVRARIRRTMMPGGDSIDQTAEHCQNPRDNRTAEITCSETLSEEEHERRPICGRIPRPNEATAVIAY